MVFGAGFSPNTLEIVIVDMAFIWDQDTPENE
ncbi:uncharacterized protein VTP21DRAFT_1111 [Calcarisporiella thermophila]